MSLDTVHDIDALGWGGEKAGSFAGIQRWFDEIGCDLTIAPRRGGRWVASVFRHVRAAGDVLPIIETTAGTLMAAAEQARAEYRVLLSAQLLDG
jgi:hypothetical protein